MLSENQKHHKSDYIDSLYLKNQFTIGSCNLIIQTTNHSIDYKLQITIPLNCKL